MLQGVIDSPWTWLAVGAAVLLTRRARGAAIAEDDVEPYLAAYEPEDGCAPPQPGAVALRRYVYDRFGGGDAGIPRECNPRTSSGHEEGRAWDWGVDPKLWTSPKFPFRAPAQVPQFLEWLFGTVGGVRNYRARQLGVMYAIYAGRVWRAYPAAGKAAGAWHAYTGSNPHDDHVHVSLSHRGAAAQTPGYERDGDAATVTI